MGNDGAACCVEGPGVSEALHTDACGAPYDLSRSTEENHAIAPECSWTGTAGDFAIERRVLDGNYHAQYRQMRVAFQDQLVKNALAKSAVETTQVGGTKAEPLQQPWILFTAGPMGAGKSHVVNWLDGCGLLPLRSFVRADPDLFRTYLPEWSAYKARDPETAGKLTQKEAGLLVELTTEAAMARGLPVWQDGSLQDVDFFKSRIEYIRQMYPEYRIVLMYVAASEATIRSRVQQRGLESGRVVPQGDLEQSQERAPLSFASLAPQADLAFIIDNNDNNGRPSLREVHQGRSVWLGERLGGLEGLPSIFRTAEQRRPLGWLLTRGPGGDGLKDDPAASATFEAPPRVHAVSWNLLAPCYFRLGQDRSPERESQQASAFAPRVRKQARILKRYDLVFLQELWLRSEEMALILAEELGDFHHIVAARGEPFQDGVAVLARRDLFDVRGRCQIPLPHGRAAAAAALSFAGQPSGLGVSPARAPAFVAVSCHLNFPHRPADEQLREHQAAALCDGIEAFVRGLAARPRGERVPVLLAGDFNTQQGLDESSAGSCFLRRGFSSAHFLAHGAGHAVTHRNHRGQLWGSDLMLAQSGRGTALRPDSVFLLPGGTGDSAPFARPRPFVALPPGDPYTLEEWSNLSDHRPLVAHLELVPAEVVSRSKL